MKSTSITVSLDTRRAKKDGTYPLILRLTHQGKTTSIKTGIHLLEKDWDADAKSVRKSYTGATNVTRLNNEIQKKKAEALDSILKLEGDTKKTPLSIVDVKHQIAPASNGQSFYVYGEKLVHELKKAGRIGTARCYEGTLNVLKTFNKGKALPKNAGGDPKKKNRLRFAGKTGEAKPTDLSFDEITYAFLKKFETYHLEAGNELNGLSVYMRTVRSIYNQAIKSGLAEKGSYPFADYKIKSTPTKKRALDAAYLSKVIALNLPKEHSCFDARNYFVASYMMYGMNFADMAHLKKVDIAHGRIHYRRKKTSKLYDIRIGDALQEILNHYINANLESAYVFPVIKRDNPLLQERDLQWARKRYNQKLKSVAELCGITHTLTSYVSRHSFATQAMLQQVPVNAISAMLGHSSLKTTEIYLKSLPSNILDEYNALVLGQEKSVAIAGSNL